MIALPVLTIAAGAVLRWALGDSASNSFTDAIGLMLMAVGTLVLAILVVSGKWWSRRARGLPHSNRARSVSR
jgi:hypothetical protein